MGQLAETREFLASLIAKYSAFFDIIKGDTLPANIAFPLLKACGPARWSYAQRSHDASTIHPFSVQFDSMVLGAACAIIGVDNSLDFEILANLPSSCGGLGLTPYRFDGDDEAGRAELISRLSPAATRTREAADPGTWLNGKAWLGSAADFKSALLVRVGAFADIKRPVRCPGCAFRLSKDGAYDHAQGCANWKGYGPTHRHTSIVHRTANLCRAAGFDVSTEVVVGKEGETIDIIAIDNNGDEHWFDVTVCAVTAKSRRNKAFTQNERAATERKRKTYETLALAHDATLTTLFMSHRGVLGAATRALCATLDELREWTDGQGNSAERIISNTCIAASARIVRKAARFVQAQPDLPAAPADAAEAPDGAYQEEEAASPAVAPPDPDAVNTAPAEL